MDIGATTADVTLPRWRRPLPSWLVPLTLVGLAVTTVGTLGAIRERTSATAPRSVVAEQDRIVNQINELRRAKRIPQLHVDPELARVATSWSSTMAETDAIVHNPKLESMVRGPWRRLGENVGSGKSADAVFEKLAASREHAAVLLDPRFDAVAVALVERNGTWYLTQNFADVPDGTTLGDTPANVPDQLGASATPEAPEA